MPTLRNEQISSVKKEGKENISYVFSIPRKYSFISFHRRKKNAMTNTAILLVLWKIRKTTKQVNFLSAKLIRITAKTYEILPIVSKAKTVAVNNLLHLP